LLAAPALDSGAGPVRVLPGVRAPELSLDPDPDPDPARVPDDDPPLDESPPRVTAVPLPPPLEPEERGVALWPSSEYELPLLKPARCCGAASRAEPKLIDGDETALADGELEAEPPLLLDPPPSELAVLALLAPPPLPRSTAPPLLDAPPPLDRSAAPPAPLSDGLDCANAGAVASVKLATTIPTLRLKAFIGAPLYSPTEDLTVRPLILQQICHAEDP